MSIYNRHINLDINHMDNAQIKFGHKVKEARVRLGISQKCLGDVIKMDRTYISGIECGRRNPSLKNIVKLCEILNIPFSKILV